MAAFGDHRDDNITASLRAMALHSTILTSFRPSTLHPLVLLLPPLFYSLLPHCHRRWQPGGFVSE